MRRFLRDLTSFLALSLAVLALGGFAWLTNHPGSPVLAAATEWPLVGPLAQRMRQAYLGTPPAAADGAAAGGDAGGSEAVVVVVEAATPSEPIRLLDPETEQRRREWIAATRERGAAADPPAAPPPPAEAAAGSELPELIEITAAPDLGRIVRRDGRGPDAPRRLALGWRWFLPGQPLRGERGAASGGRELPSLAFLPVLSREGGWAEVLYQGRSGWADESWQVPHPRRGARQGGMRARFEPVRASRSDLLRQARRVLGIGRTEEARSLGDYELYTDADDGNLLAMLDQIAAVAEDAYFARFARLPSGDPLRTAVLFASEADYRAYSGDRLPASGHAGHAAGGVLASYVEGRPRRAVATTLVHEIAHLVNARALARELPVWLEEGLAEELAALWVEDDAEIDSADRRAATLAASFRGPSEIDRRLLALGAALDRGGLPRLPRVLTMDQEQFYASESWLHYAYAGAFVRYLMDGDGGRHREGFLRFLKRIADGYSPNPALLLDSYGTRDVEYVGELERGFREWLARERVAATGRVRGGR